MPRCRLSFGRGFVGSVRCPSVRLSADRLSAQGATPSITPSTTPSNALPPSTGQRVVVFVRTKTHLSWLTVSRREKKIKKRKETYKKKERKFHSSASAIQGQRCLRLRSEDTNKPQECRATN